MKGEEDDFFVLDFRVVSRCLKPRSCIDAVQILGLGRGRPVSQKLNPKKYAMFVEKRWCFEIVFQDCRKLQDGVCYSMMMSAGVLCKAAKFDP